jgi:hypothetical protein
VVCQLQWAEKEKKIRNQVDWLKRQHGYSSLTLLGIKPNRVKQPVNQIQNIEIWPKLIIRKVRSRPYFGSHFDSFFLFPLSSSILICWLPNKAQSTFSALMQNVGYSVYFYLLWPDRYSKLANLPPFSCCSDYECSGTSVRSAQESYIHIILH